MYLLHAGSWPLPILFCNLFIFSDVFLSTSSIWHLTILSIYRWLHISRPFRSRERSKRKTFLTILFIWTFSIIISCIMLILGCLDKNNILVIVSEHRRYCTLNNRSFIVYGSIICFCIPCALMLVTYSLTIRRLRLQAAQYYADPDNHLTVKPQTSQPLRRHKSCTTRYSLEGNYNNKTSKEILSLSITSAFSTTLTDTNNKPNQLQST